MSDPKLPSSRLGSGPRMLDSGSGDLLNDLLDDPPNPTSGEAEATAQRYHEWLAFHPHMAEPVRRVRAWLWGELSSEEQTEVAQRVRSDAAWAFAVAVVAELRPVQGAPAVQPALVRAYVAGTLPAAERLRLQFLTDCCRSWAEAYQAVLRAQPLQ